MRFLMMIKGDEQSEAGAMPSEKIIEAMSKYNDELVNAGAMLAGEGLHPTSKGARVKFSKGKPVVTDGPFAEAKEVIAGYWIIQAKSKAEAVEWAKRIPMEAGETPGSSGTGQVEIRQIFELEDFPVNENESGWREHEAGFREQYGNARPPEPGRKQFIIFRMADKDSESGAMPTEEQLAAMGQYNDELIKSGIMLAGEGLHPSSEGTRVYYSGGKRRVVDGPFTESKEVIAGFSMIQAKSKQEAVEIAKRWPAFDANGEVELQVRQVFGMDEFGEELTPELRAAEERQRRQVSGKQ